MKIQILPFRLVAVSVLLFWSMASAVQQNNTGMSPLSLSRASGKGNDLSEEYAHLFHIP